ncbi:PAS domain S-box protein [Leptolyngbya sp. FACHB-16]|uniref:PAS domain-containing hybrid sensor histidine kinase/response regulator n=1 Tax=unclassified Leptolyngbya TaxID=2650499 RepID=UPI001686C04E|nr:PAS domain S-box protein [Leptolyngbya sp. FACHB-16]MBD2153555.1 PAS domain S-box protein [Leptolyngbya sp. FACHB-16]
MVSEQTFLLSEYHRLPQEALRADFYKRQLEVVCNNATLALFIMDERQECVYMNPAAEALTGYSLSETRGRALHDVIHHTRPDGRPYPLCECPIDQAFPQNNQEQGEEVFVHKDGHFYPVAYTASPIREGDRVLGTIIEVRDITQEKLAEQARQESAKREQLLRQEAEMAQKQVETIFASISDGVFVLDHNWCYTYVSDRLCKMASRSREEMIGHSIWDLFPEAVNTEVYPQFHRAMREQVHLQFEYLHLPWNRWFECRVYPSEQGITVFAAEITDRKRDKEVLQESERRFRRLAESNIFGVAFGNFAGGIHYANDYFLNMVGYTREEVEAGQVQWTDLTPPEFLPLDVAAEEELKVKGVATPFEKEYIRKDGARVPILIGAALLDEPYDQQQDIIGFYLDLTERKRSEEALQQALQKLNFHVENTPMAVVEWNGAMQVTRWSGAAEKIFGWQADDVLGKLLNDLPIVTEEGIEEVVETCKQLMSGEEPYVFSSNSNYTKQGDIIHCEWYNSSLHDETGQLISVLSLVLDVTDKKRAEAEREQLLIREQVARAAAEQANRIKDEFLAIVSHELRSPLNPILGWSKLLQQQKLDPAKTSQALETIARNAALQAELIEDLLDVSRILRGKLSLNIAPTDLASIIQAALETMRLPAESKSIQVHTWLEPDVGSVAGDSNRLQQVVWNLLSNAIKFTPTGGRVDIRLERVDSMAQITVRDTGKGIHPNFLPHVFAYFRQEDGATTRKFGGLGLGLAIVHHLVELHGGTIQAESPGEGLGATFTVKLPLLQGSSPTMQGGSLLEPEAGLTGIHVLVVDDDADTREVVAFLLEQAGAQITTFASASEVLAALSHTQIDVLLSDIGMPDVDGYMLLRQVRALPPEQGGQIPAIALTAYAGEIDYQQAMAAGYQKHLTKPIEPELLVRAIADVVRRKEQEKL